jgi:hypothetical protein
MNFEKISILLWELKLEIGDITITNNFLYIN